MLNSGSKILVAEDEPDIQFLLKFILEKDTGFKVLLCDSGAKAIKEAETFSPDLILLDMMMPEMDGIHTLAALRKVPALNKIPVIFITAKAQPDEVLNYKKLGVLDVIVKPFNATSLVDDLKKIVGGNS